MATGLSSTLVIPAMAMTSMMNTNNLRVMSDNMGAVVNLLVLLLTMSSDNIFTFLNVGNIYDNIILDMTFVMGRLLGDLVAVMVLLVVALRTTGVAMTATSRRSSTKDSRGRDEEN